MTCYIPLKEHFLCSLRITTELGYKNQYFGINELNKSREFDAEAYSDRTKKVFPKKF